MIAERAGKNPAEADTAKAVVLWRREERRVRTLGNRHRAEIESPLGSEHMINFSDAVQNQQKLFSTIETVIEL